MNKTICILPWTHFFHNPSGKITPCCAASDNTQFDYGNIKDHTNHKDIINQDSFNQLRKNMLEGTETDVCTHCYQAEANGGGSFRTSKNSMIDQMITMDEINNMTNADGSLKDFKMRYWDVRFSNVCNLACRMCGPEYSHTLAKEVDKTFNGKHIVKAHDSDEWNQIVQKYGPLDELYDIYFAGGEVLFQKEHWQMLDHLISIGKTDVMIMYVTNLTKLDYDSYRLMDYLPKFRDVTFTVSMDGTGALLEYIRWGAKWDQIVNNLNTLKQLPNVNLRVNHVTMWYNVLALPDTLEFIFGNDYLQEPHQLDLYVAHEPENHVGALPDDLKLVAIEQIKSSRYYPLLQEKLDAVCNAMMTYDYPLPTYHLTAMDQRRGCDILDVLPEVESYL